MPTPAVPSARTQSTDLNTATNNDTAFAHARSRVAGSTTYNAALAEQHGPVKQPEPVVPSYEGLEERESTSLPPPAVQQPAVEPAKPTLVAPQSAPQYAAPSVGGQPQPVVPSYEGVEVEKPSLAPPPSPTVAAVEPVTPPPAKQAAVEPAKPASEALALPTPSAPAVAPPMGKRVALVIGNSQYQNVTRLDNPVNDAKLMADALKSLGFKLIGEGPQLDLEKAGFDSAVQAFGNQLQGAEVGLFYYAGHGVQVRGSNYLVPISANPTREADVDFQMVDAALVLRQMEAAGTKLNVVMLDACRNNPFGGRGLRASIGGLTQMPAPEGTLISFATQPGNVAQDGTDGDSPYTKALAEIIRRPGLDVFQTFNQVGLAVKKATGGSQQPWVSNSPIEGDFYFAGK
jgi:hypothetical protein